jgi:predicted GIY-YIG superfamily endonuclease
MQVSAGFQPGPHLEWNRNGTLGFMRRSRLAALQRERWSEPHMVYELYDCKGDPLYVGCTLDLARRLTQHAVKSWWRDVAEVHSRIYPDRDAALAVELRLIRELQPAWNFVGTERASESARDRHAARRSAAMVR